MPIATDEAVVRVRGEVDASFAASTTNIRTAMQQLAADVQQANTDFEAGNLSVSAYQRALSNAQRDQNALNRVLAQAAPAVGGVNRTLQQTQRAAGAAGQGIGTVRSTLAVMSAQAIGASGRLGTLGGALLQFGAGNTLALGAVAGIAAMALAWRHFTKDAKEAEEQAKKTGQEIDRIRQGRAGRPGELLGLLGAAGGTLTDTRRELADRIAALRAPRTRAFPGGAPVTIPGLTDEEVAADPEVLRLQGEVARLEGNVRFLQDELARATREAAKRQGEDRVKALDQEVEALLEGARLRVLTEGDMRRILQIERQLTAELEKQTDVRRRGAITEQIEGLRGVVGFDLLPGLMTRLPPIQRPRPGLGSPIGMRTSSVSEEAVLPEGLLPQIDLMGLERFGFSVANVGNAAAGAASATDRLALSQQRFGVAAINTAAAMISMIVSGGGGVGGFLGLAGGLLSFINPLAGVAVGGLGAIISSASSRDPIPVSLENVSDRAARRMADRGPIELTLVVTDARGNIQETLIRRERRDAQRRFGNEVAVVLG